MIITPFEYAGAAGSRVVVVWVVALVLLGIVGWAIMRSKVPAPSMTGAQAVAGGGKRK